MKRVAIYARYSSDNQREASIEDQIRECRARAEREGWPVVQEYGDRAISGAAWHRPKLQALLRDAKDRRFDIVLAESLDRFSRDQEHTAAFFKQLDFVGIRIVTLAEGDIGPLHVGLKGTMNALHLKDLADKTRRGLRGRVEAGKSGGGLSYGYAVVRGQTDDDHGEFEVVPAQARIVVEVFERYVAGTSPKAIAQLLNKRRVPGLAGRCGRRARSTATGSAALAS
jgi:DNA invertase Pin-like site-specific DNA recombinase